MKLTKAHLVGGLVLVVACVTVVGALAASGSSSDGAKNPNPLRGPLSGTGRASEKTAPGAAVVAPLPAGATSFPTGIIEANGTPVPGFVQENEWGGLIGGDDVVIHAGSKESSDGSKSSTASGMLIKMTFSADGRLLDSTDIVNGSVPGPFRIVSASGNVLTIASGGGPSGTGAGAGGTSFTLDAVTGKVG